MTHRIINILLFIGILSAYAVVMNADYSTEMAESQELLDAQKQAQRELQKELAAAKVCRETHGNSAIAWTADGELVCVPRKPRYITKAAL